MQVKKTLMTAVNVAATVVIIAATTVFFHDIREDPYQGWIHEISVRAKGTTIAEERMKSYENLINEYVKAVNDAGNGKYQYYDNFSSRINTALENVYVNDGDYENTSIRGMPVKVKSVEIAKRVYPSEDRAKDNGAIYKGSKEIVFLVGRADIISGTGKGQISSDQKYIAVVSRWTESRPGDWFLEFFFPSRSFEGKDIVTGVKI